VAEELNQLVPSDGDGMTRASEHANPRWRESPTAPEGRCPAPCHRRVP
jgi:hypothetical protein